MVKTGLQKFREAVEILNQVYAELPIQQILIFLEVAEHGEISMRDLRLKLNMSPSSLTRNLVMLSLHQVENPANPREKMPKGHGLIERRHDISDPRTLITCLTNKGREVRDKIEAACRC